MGINNSGKIYSNCFEIGSTDIVNIDLDISKIIFKDDIKKKFLLVGEVQSGKTTKIVELIKHAVEIGYDFCIVFGGVTNLLNEQTKTRFEEKIPDSIGGRSKDFVDSKKITKNLRFNTQKFFYVLTFLKGSDSINKLKDFFVELNSFNTKRVLLIDDETDYATVISKQQGSAIHELICDVWKKIIYGKLLLVTATPFANILSPENDPLYFEEILLMEGNEEYTGSKFFLQHAKNCYFCLEDTSKKNIESWKDAIHISLATFLLSTVLYKKRFPDEKTEFLLNIDSEIPKQDIAINYINQSLKKYLEYPDNFNEWLKKAKQNKFNDIEINEQEIMIEISNVIKQIINDHSIVWLKSGESYFSGKHVYCIIVGGVLLSRGITFKYLLTELILNARNEKNSVDTLLQRARWFGYRKIRDRYKYMSIYMNKEISNSLSESNKAINLLNSTSKSNKLKSELESFQKGMKFAKLTGKPKIQKIIKEKEIE